MDASDVLDLLSALDEKDVHYWLDGGWGVDCLLGEQNRQHGDLDLVVPRLELDRVRALLAARGYSVIRDWLPMSLAYRDDRGREVDLHPVDSTADGGGTQVLLEGRTWHYGPPVEGSIEGRAVRCATAEDQLLMHQGYALRSVDVEDVRRMAERFGLRVPAPSCPDGMTSVSAMPPLGPTDPLPHRPNRVLVAGTSGSGKTTLAARIADALAVPHVEIDALFHGPDWTPRPSFEEDVRRFSDGPGWVTEWQYRSVRAHLAERADLLVWLDLPKAVVMRQVVRRTLVRRLRRQPLWNGNIEPPVRTILTDPEHIVRWAWTTHDKTARRVSALLQERPDCPVVRLRSHAEAHRWLQGPLRQALNAPP